MRISSKIRRAGLGAALLPLAALAACSFEVTNPGPVQQKFLSDPSAGPALVNGAGRDLSDALNWISYTSAAASREIFPAGSTGSFGITVKEQIGILSTDESDTFWNYAQRARWEAESADSTLKAGMSASAYGASATIAQVKLWAAYANRLLGENMCDATINAGPKLPYTAFLSRAEQEFSDALTIATAANNTTLANAARAGRASVRADQGNWTGAVQDAAAIADNFVYTMPYFANTTDAALYNRIYWATANAPYRAHTVWNTFYDSYYTNTKDPRVSWSQDPKTPNGDGAVLQLGKVPWHFETKFAKKDAGINLSSGWEMRLLQAEAALGTGDVATALPLLNKHRVALGLQPWTATTTADAYTALKRERGIELWMEARRLGDLRRWDAAKTPGDLSPYEVPGSTSYLDANRNLCFPIPLSELQTNPNLNH